MGFYKITVEVPFALVYFAFQLIGNIIINLYMYKTCYNILKYPEEDCLRLGRYTDNATSELEKIVQPSAGTITVISEMVPVALPVVLALLLGSWSDKHGRKPVLIAVLLCLTGGLLIGAIMLSFKELNPWWMMIGAIPTVLCGGAMTFIMIAMSYLNDTATPENRALKMVSIDVIQIGTSFAGGLSSSYILYATNYASVYGICALLGAASCAYAYFFCPESLKTRSEEKRDIKSIFQWNNLTDLFSVTLKNQDYQRRTIILLLIAAQILIQFVANGEGNTKTLYLRNKFTWTLTEKNIFSACSNVLFMLCTIASTYLLHNKLKIKETVIILISMAFAIISTLLFALGHTDYFVYISAVVGAFSGLGVPMIRTILAKYIVPEEMGKIFSLVTVINNFSMLAASMLYIQIYNATLDTHPELFNYISFGCFAAVVIIIIITMILETRLPPKVGELDENYEKVESTE